jgi:hypothetical protein
MTKLNSSPEPPSPGSRKTVGDPSPLQSSASCRPSASTTKLSSIAGSETSFGESLPEPHALRKRSDNMSGQMTRAPTYISCEEGP